MHFIGFYTRESACLMLRAGYKRSDNIYSPKEGAFFFQSIHMKQLQQKTKEKKDFLHYLFVRDRVFHHHVSPGLPPSPARVSSPSEGDLATEYCETERCYFGVGYLHNKRISGIFAVN